MAKELFYVLEHRIGELNEVGRTEEGGTKFVLITNGNPGYIGDDISYEIYLIINELCNNILKHAEATEADIQLLVDEKGKSITIMAEDNGKGFDVDIPKKGIGIIGITSMVGLLNGNIKIDSGRKGSGTIIMIKIPIFIKGFGGAKGIKGVGDWWPRFLNILK